MSHKLHIAVYTYIFLNMFGLIQDATRATWLLLHTEVDFMYLRAMIALPARTSRARNRASRMRKLGDLLFFQILRAAYTLVSIVGKAARAKRRSSFNELWDLEVFGQMSLCADRLLSLCYGLEFVCFSNCNHNVRTWFWFENCSSKDVVIQNGAQMKQSRDNNQWDSNTTVPNPI